MSEAGDLVLHEIAQAVTELLKESFDQWYRISRYDAQRMLYRITESWDALRCERKNESAAQVPAELPALSGRAIDFKF